RHDGTQQQLDVARAVRVLLRQPAAAEEGARVRGGLLRLVRGLLGLDARVQARRELVDRPGELRPRAGDLVLELGLGQLGRRGPVGSAHERSPSLMVATSSLMPSTAPVGVGGTPRCSCLTPTNASVPATSTSASPTISAASQRGITGARPSIAECRRNPRPYRTSTPPTTSMPMPMPACLALVASSVFASAISDRTRRVACSDSRSTSCPTVGFCSSGGMRPSIQSLISPPFR